VNQTSNWKDVAEIIALLAVVASLVVVVVELRQTQVALGAQAYQARSFQAYDHHLFMAERPELDALLRSSRADDFDFSSLSASQKSALLRLYYAARADFDNEHYQFQEGFLAESFYLAVTARDIKTYAPTWRALGIESLRPEFKIEVDRILSDESVKTWPTISDSD
jgi:hypothetical protein